MSCYNKCSHEQEILDRLANIEAKETHDVQTVNGVYGPFVRLEIPDVSYLTDQVEQNKENITALGSEIDTTNADVAGLTYVKEILSYEATPITFKARVKMRDDSIVEMVLPLVDNTNIGTMTPSAYAQIWTNKAQIEQMLSGTSIPTGDLETANPSQLQLTTLWITTMTRDPADGDRVMNTFDNVVWLFASGVWHAISESSTPMATNETLGTVMGSTSEGKSQVELDGTLSVNGWDARGTRITNLESGKVNKVAPISSYDQVYGVLKTGETPEQSVLVVDNPTSYGYGRVPKRAVNGNLYLPNEDSITLGNYAASKDYVDHKIISASNITILTSNWIANTDSADLYAMGYLYQYTIPVTGMVTTMIPTIVPSYDDYVTGNLWGRCQSIAGGITIYSKQNVAMTILSAIGTVI